MKTAILLAGAAIFLCLEAQAQDEPLKISQVAARGARVTAFVPLGWKIEKQVGGDLNRDKIPDVALVLTKNTRAKDTEGYPVARPRALVVALRRGNVWRRVGFSVTILLGTRDGGAFYGVVETPVNVSIKKGVLIVQQDSGSREILDTTHRFRFDARKNGVFLIGHDSSNRDRLNGNARVQSTNYLTGIRQTQIFKMEKPNGTAKTSRVSTKLRSLESVRDDERYEN